MQANELDLRIDNFLRRKYAAFPDLAAAGRNESRTIKYARALRVRALLLMAH
ncbi:MAG TPA: hypothetical protein VMB52_04795 [Verrucomicrobiae bacterium]|nr:hypothetical protein [Verrucomicrobiae bacterium]